MKHNFEEVTKLLKQHIDIESNTGKTKDITQIIHLKSEINQMLKSIDKDTIDIEKINSLWHQGNSILYYAITYDYIELIKFLSELNPPAKLMHSIIPDSEEVKEVEAQEYIPLNFAIIENCSEEIVKYLYNKAKFEDKLTAVGKDGRTFLPLAILEGEKYIAILRDCYKSNKILFEGKMFSDDTAIEKNLNPNTILNYLQKNNDLYNSIKNVNVKHIESIKKQEKQHILQYGPTGQCGVYIKKQGNSSSQQISSLLTNQLNKKNDSTVKKSEDYTNTGILIGAAVGMLLACGISVLFSMYATIIISELISLWAALEVLQIAEVAISAIIAIDAIITGVFVGTGAILDNQYNKTHLERITTKRFEKEEDFFKQI